MTDSNPDHDAYALGHSAAETQRLMLQDQLFGSFTRQLFRDAGLRSGMTVLDIGSGAGDVALLAAELVGPTGSVLGIDVNSKILETAQNRAGAAGLSNVSFRAGDVASLAWDQEFDAIVGRCVLMHLPDPVAVLRHLAHGLRRGGVVAFHEFYLDGPWASDPPSPALQQVQRMRETANARRATVDSAMGLKLYRVFVEAGFPAPRLRMDGVIGGGPAWPGFDYIAATVRSLLPSWQQLGIAATGEMEVETLAGRLRAEIGERGGAALLQPIIGAWTRT